jgi:general secretion pathway protein H
MNHVPKKHAQYGFTLLEIMLVFGLIGLIMATVSYTVFSKNIEQEIEKEVQRLQVVFSMASDYAVINQFELGLRLDEDKQTYEFVKLGDDETWSPIDQSKHFALREMPLGVSIKLTLEGLSWQQDDSLFDGRIFDEELSVRDAGVDIGSEEDKEPPPPQIFILSSGEITPFELKIEYTAQDSNEDNFEFSLRGIDTVPLLRGDFQ